MFNISRIENIIENSLYKLYLYKLFLFYNSNNEKDFCILNISFYNY